MLSEIGAGMEPHADLQVGGGFLGAPGRRLSANESRRRILTAEMMSPGPDDSLPLVTSEALTGSVGANEKRPSKKWVLPFRRFQLYSIVGR